MLNCKSISLSLSQSLRILSTVCLFIVANSSRAHACDKVVVSLSPSTTFNYNSDGGPGVSFVELSYGNGCFVPAATASSWIQGLTPSVGFAAPQGGEDTVNYYVPMNPYNVSRTATVMWWGYTVTIIQDANPDGVPPPPPPPSAEISVATATDSTGPPFQMLPSNQSGSSYPNNFVSQLGIVISCIDASTHQPIGGCALNDPKFAPTPKTGGHNHDDPSRPSFLKPASIVTTGTGLSVLYTAPEVSGDIVGTASGTDPQGNQMAPVPFTINVGLGPLSELAAVPSIYELTGDTPVHPSNHWGLRSFDVALINSATTYKQLLKPGEPVLGINDMTLQFGGIFDIHADSGSPWKSPHNTHREGHSADIGSGQGLGFKGSIPVGQRKKLRAILYLNSLQPIRENQGGVICDPQNHPLLECTHWHVEPK